MRNTVRTSLIILAAVIGLTAAPRIIAADADAASQPGATSPAIKQLQTRISKLEKAGRLRTIMILNLRSQLDAIDTTPELDVVAGAGIAESIETLSWGYVDAQCHTGEIVSAGFETDYPVDVGTIRIDPLTNSVNISAFNRSFNNVARFKAIAICASID